MSNGDKQVIDYTVGDALKLAKIDDLINEWRIFKKFGYLVLSTVLCTALVAIVNMAMKWG